MRETSKTERFKPFLRLVCFQLSKIAATALVKIEHINNNRHFSIEFSQGHKYAG